MKMPMRLFVMTDPETGDVTVTDAVQLARIGLESDEQIRVAFGEDGEWREVWLREASHRLRTKADQMCTQIDPVTGAQSRDDTLLPAARCEVMVEKWNGFPAAPSREAFDALPPNLADALNALIVLHLFPRLATNANFMQAWSVWRKRSAPETPVP